jgi:outer membrane receptor for ferrienterochelin and colicin
MLPHKLRRLPPSLWHILLGITAAAWQTGVWAQDIPDLNAMPIEQLLNLDVVTASKIPQKLSEAPSSVSVITAEDIRQRGYRSLADILQNVRGVQVSYDRNYSYAAVRGLGYLGDLNTRLLILVDGRRLNDVIYDQGALGTEFPIDVSLIDRVEFVPGPGSAIYGSSAFFGVVNVITKSGATLNGSALSAARSTAGGREARMVTGGRHAGIETLLGVAWLDNPGRDLYFPEYDDAGSRGIAHHLDYDRYRRLFAKVGAGGFGAEAYAARRTKGIPTASYGQQFGDPRSRTIDEYAGVGLSWRHALLETMEVYASLNATRYRYAGDYLYVRDTSLNLDLSDSATHGGELRLLSSAFAGHRLIAGAEYLRDSARHMRNIDSDPEVLYLDIDRPKRRAAVYVQDEMRLTEQLILNSGVRHDYDSEGGHTTNPRVALLYKTTPQVTLKALYGTAYRSANAYERYYTTNVDYKLNHDLRSERIKTYELIAEYFPTDRFRAGASLFQYRLRDLLALTTDPHDGRLFFSNMNAARATGVELEAEWLRADGASLKGSASLQSAHDDANGAWLGNSPRRLFKLNYSVPLAGERLRASLEARMTSRRRTAAECEVGGFGLANLTLLGSLPDSHVELSASIYNLFAKRYADAASEEHFDNSTPPRRLAAIAQDGRTWRVLATLRF